MSRFPPPQGDPHGLRDAARRLTAAGAGVRAGGEQVLASSSGTLGSWHGSASLLMAARAQEVRRVAQQSEHALTSLAAATDRYADEVERARTEVARLNEAWDDAVWRARRQAAAAAASLAALPAGTAPGSRPTFDDGSAALAEAQAELERRYRRLEEELEEDGFSLERALASRDPLAFLPPWMAGGAYATQAVVKAVGLGTRAVHLGRYSLLLRQAAQHFPLGAEKVVKGIRSSDDYKALLAALHGKPSTMPVAGTALTKAGKAFLPVTVATGALDAFTGGGYEGWRDPVTRVAGAAGAVGGAALIASASSVAFALGPVGVAVAGAAVLAYGAWSLGNAVYDNREAIAAFGDRVRDGAVHVATQVQARAVAHTLDAAKGVLGGVRALDAGRTVVAAITSPAKLVPRIAGLF